MSLVNVDEIPYFDGTEAKIIKLESHHRSFLSFSRGFGLEKPKIIRKNEVPIWEKSTLTLSEAAEYSGIGIHKLRELSDEKNCQFVLWNGNRRLIKRKQLDEFINSAYSI